MADSIDADATSGHRLKQSALRARAGAIDLVGQQHLREQRSGLKTKIGFNRVEHIQAGEIRRQQITGETHPFEGKPKHPSQGFCQGRLTHARPVFDQQMATGQQTTERQTNLMLLAQQQPANGIHQRQKLRC